MNFKRTTIIPLDDPELAKQLFDAYLNKEFMILMIILGDTETIREAMPKADNLATKSYFGMERWVFWVRNHDILADSLIPILEANDEAGNLEYESVKCFCTSPVLDAASGIILKNGELNYRTLQKSFFMAQSHDIGLINVTNDAL